MSAQKNSTDTPMLLDRIHELRMNFAVATAPIQPEPDSALASALMPPVMPQPPTPDLPSPAQLKIPAESSLGITKRYSEQIKTVLGEIQQKYKELLARDAKQLEEIEKRIAQNKKTDTQYNYPVLTPEQEKQVDQTLLRNDGGTVVEEFNLILSTDDIGKLKDRVWLNDEVINFYVRLVVERAVANPGFPTVFAFNTFFYVKMLEEGYAGVRRWAKKADIFSYDHILIPVHLGMHWCLANINFSRKRFEYYDSLQGRNPQVHALLRTYVKSEHEAKKGKPFDFTDWSDYYPTNAPCQENGYDCGVFACIFAEYVSRDEPLTFSQADMRYFRRRMIYEILSKKLMIQSLSESKN